MLGVSKLKVSGVTKMMWPKEQDSGIRKSQIYEIRLRGKLDKDWSEWFEGMTISYDDGLTILKGKVLDQAALRGLLTKIWDLNHTVISETRIRE